MVIHAQFMTVHITFEHVLLFINNIITKFRDPFEVITRIPKTHLAFAYGEVSSIKEIRFWEL